mgnify:CR=1 FL=1|tara:strand:+ start:3915 stop:5072 length:1158 start_codon:yes stop_codon:yes gene_type:complete
MSKRDSVSILGSTGSIGKQTLSVIKEQKDKFKIESLAAGKNISLLLKQISEFKPTMVSVDSTKDQNLLKKNPLLKRIVVLSGEKGLRSIAKSKNIKSLVVATSGVNALVPTIDSLKLGKRVCIASKEVFLLYGKQIMKIAKNNNAEIIPIDSEHSALFQLIGNEPKENIRRLYITASGGPFFNKKRKDLKNVQPKDALKHPTWNMGEKISIDSATMMNKAIEIIEASIMFDINHKMITPVVNLDSHIHGIAEFVDGSYSISGSFNDMKIPISYSLNYPLRQNKRNYKFKIDKKIELIPIKESAYEAISIARKAMEIGGTMPTIMNAANSVAVSQFLKKEIAFLDIYKVIKKTMKNSFPEYNSSLKEILKINKTASEDAFNICNRL